MKKFVFLFALVCAPAGVYAQTNGALLPALPQQFLTANGAPAANGRLCTTASGTNTPQAVFSDSGLTMPLPNPIKLNAAGIATTSGGTQAAVYTTARSYRVTLYGAGVSSNLCNGTTVGAIIWQFDNIYDFAQLNGSGGGGGVGGGNGQCNASAQTGTDAGAKISACIAALPSTGGIVNAEGLPGTQSWGVCPSFGTSPITLLLGVGTYAISPSCTIPSNVEINFPIGACLSVASGKTLQINGPIDAGISQSIFCGTGTTTTPNQSIVYPQWWGAHANGILLGGPLGGGSAGCTGTATSAVITCPSGAFTGLDVGKVVDLSHAGTASCGQRYTGPPTTMNCNLVTTILSVSSLTSITLSVALGSSVTNEQLAYGTADDAFLLQAYKSGATQIGISGTYVVSSTTYAASAIVQLNNQSVIASSLGAGRFLGIGPVAYDGKASAMFILDNSSSNVTFQNLQFLGTNEFGELTTFGAQHDGILFCTGNPGNGMPGACNANPVTSITDIKIINSTFSYIWGIGLHMGGSSTAVGQQVSRVYVGASTANFNSYDGFNTNIYDALVMDGDTAFSNGTGGIEAATNSMTITGGHYLFNRTAGISIAGFTGIQQSATCEVTGNDVSENGNGYLTSTTGVGILVEAGAHNCTISGNTIRHNHLIGLEFVGFSSPSSGSTTINNTAVGNTITSNGLVGGSGVGVGIFGGFVGDNISDNVVSDETTSIVFTGQRTSNVVTITTDTPHEYLPGYSVTLTGTGGGGAFNGTFTIATVPTVNTFTFAQVAANAGPFSGGSAVSTGSGFQQAYGMNVTGATNTIFNGNYIFNNVNANVNFNSGTYINTIFTGNNSPNPTTDLFTAQAPALGGLVLRIPDIQTTGNVCTTAASAAATCTTVISHFLLSTPNNTQCVLDNAPNAQTGKPLLVKVDTSTSTNTATVTIGTLDGNAAGGGTMRCKTNYAY